MHGIFCIGQIYINTVLVYLTLILFVEAHLVFLGIWLRVFVVNG
jgi:hypothetical protein